MKASLKQYESLVESYKTQVGVTLQAETTQAHIGVQTRTLSDTDRRYRHPLLTPEKLFIKMSLQIRIFILHFT